MLNIVCQLLPLEHASSTPRYLRAGFLNIWTPYTFSILKSFWTHGYCRDSALYSQGSTCFCWTVNNGFPVSSRNKGQSAISLAAIPWIPISLSIAAWLISSTRSRIPLCFDFIPLYAILTIESLWSFLKAWYTAAFASAWLWAGK